MNRPRIAIGYPCRNSLFFCRIMAIVDRQPQRFLYRVWFSFYLVVDINIAVDDLEFFAGQADKSFDVILLFL